MNVKIQGGGNGTYANTGSCVAVTNYLQHEDLERMKKGEEVQPFFNQFRDYVSAREVTFKIDNNKAKLSRTDAKFYVITVSPSEKELRCMGRTPQERAEALQRYIRQDVMRNYAEGFGKGLRSDDVEYYAKIHFNRDGDSDSDMHAHIIVSRKDRSNTKKLSPKTNHTGKKNCGNVKGGFDRTDFFRKCESSFDRRMGFDREPEESFDYLNAVKNGSPAEIARQDPEQQIEVKGRDLVTGIPQNIIITSEEVRKAISEQVDSIVQAVRIALEQTPPELAADIVDRGIVLTGGGALLKGLDQLLREETSLPITVVEDPLSTVVMGTGRALDNLNELGDVCID